MCTPLQAREFGSSSNPDTQRQSDPQPPAVFGGSHFSPVLITPLPQIAEKKTQ